MPSHNPHLLTRPDRVDPAVCFAVVGGWVFRPLLSQIVMARFRLIYRVLPGFVLGPGACAAHVARWPSRCDGLWLPLGYSGPGSGLVGWRRCLVPAGCGRCAGLRAVRAACRRARLADQVAFQLGDCADDDHDGPAQRAASIDIFSEADVLDLETTELVQDFEEVFDTHLQALLGDRP